MNKYSFQTQITMGFLELVVVVFVPTVTFSEIYVFHVILFHQGLSSSKLMQLL